MPSSRQIKLGLIPMGAGGPGKYNTWHDPEIPGDASVNIDWYIDVAKQAEAAKLDLIFIVDSQFITPDSPPHYLNRLEPLTLLSALATHTKRIGLVGTLTTSYNSPFNIARRLASLDLISRGRAGWNAVTSGDAGTAGNYSREEHFDYDTRYGRALESVAVLRGLWKSYRDGAFVRDRATGVFLDKEKLQPLDHKGEHFQVVGPLNIERSCQGEPVLFQAGDSNQGRDFGARVAEGIFTHAVDIESSRRFYEDIKGRAVNFGRAESDIVILPNAEVIVGDTDRQARDLERHYHESDHSFDQALSEFGRSFGWHDFRQYDLDAPFPVQALEHARNSFYTKSKKITEVATERGWSLRQTIESLRAFKPGPFVGTAEAVAEEMIRWFDARALDGFNIRLGHPAAFRRFTQDVIPILQARGYFRTAYEADTLRGHLGLKIPLNP